MRIGKNGCIELNKTHCCTRKFNIALSLCRVLGIALYFSKGFSEAATGGSAVAKALQPLRVTIVYFLEQEFSLQSPVPQQRHKLFLKYFLCLLLVNLPLLASLKERSTCRELDCFLEIEDRNDLKKNVLADKAIRDEFILFQETMARTEVEAFPCF